MGSRSRSRERARRKSRSRSPVRSKSGKKDDRRPRQNEQRPYIKKERIDERKDKDPDTRIKSEPKENSEPSAFGGVKSEDDKEPEKPSFALSGKLMEDTNVFNGVVIK